MYQKAMNAYLYLPLTSAHPLSIIRGMIYSMLRKYDEQNSHRKHYIEMTVLLFRRLAACGWDTALLQRIFNDATAKFETKFLSRTQERKVNLDNGRNRIFIHIEYHPNGIPRKEIRLAYQETCGDAFQDLTIENGGIIQTTETTIDYSRPQNLRYPLTSAKLCEGKGRGVSAFL